MPHATRNAIANSENAFANIQPNFFSDTRSGRGLSEKWAAALKQLLFLGFTFQPVSVFFF